MPTVLCHASSPSAAKWLAATALAAAMGCEKAPTLRHPVGRTTTISGESVATDSYVPPSVDLYLAEQRPGPCGMDALPAIEFAFGSSQLSSPALRSLGALAECLESKPFETMRLVLVGRADPIGSATYNLELAFDRAASVRERLIELGITPQRIVVTSAGETALPLDRWSEARRVEMILTRPEVESGATAP